VLRPPDDRIRIDTRVSPRLRDAIVAGAQAQQITIDKWMRLVARDALRAQGIPQ
jgi:predicted HicB family RNase H-like nuclease